jgi:two-component system chemotaxis sensor kinase CheA
MDLEKYRTLFVDEATEHLAEMSNAVTTLEKRPSPEEASAAVDCLFRMAHSIKGMAGSLEYHAPEALAHKLEDWMEPLRDGGEVDAAGIALLYDTLSALENMIRVVSQSGGALDPRPDLIQRLSAPPSPSDSAETQPSRRGRSGRSAEPRRGSGSDRAPAAARPEGPEPAPPPLPPTLRVRAETMDRFLAGVGDLMQRHARVEALVTHVPDFAAQHEIAEELDRMEFVARDLQRRALEIRTTPMRHLFDRVPRLASELARRLGKRVEVQLGGEEVEVDRAVLDHLYDPLLHLVRNAVDHGIELPEERLAAGKPTAGRISISAEKVGTRIRLRVREDGRGIEVERVRRKAIELGLLLEAVAEDLPEPRVYELIFEPGMSTREAVTEVSGRGVGLDAVQRSVEALGGSILVESAPAAGTTFELDLPSTVAVQRLLVLEVGSDRLTLPAARAERVVALDEGLVEGVGGDAFFVWNDEPLPLLDLSLRLGCEPPATDTRPGGAAVLLEVKGFRLALRVDRASEEVEAFVREVPAALAAHPLLGGVAVLSDGAPVFLLEPSALVEEPV